MRNSLILAAALTLSACTSAGPLVTKERQEIASAHIGCAPAEISVLNTGPHTWEATCRSKVFYCTVAPDAICTARM